MCTLRPPARALRYISKENECSFCPPGVIRKCMPSISRLPFPHRIYPVIDLDASSLILSCIFLYLTQYYQGTLVFFLFSKNKVHSFCRASALLFLLPWHLTWLDSSPHVNLSSDVISLVRPCLTTPSHPYPILNHSIILSHFIVFTALLPSENICFFVYLFIICLLVKEAL